MAPPLAIRRWIEKVEGNFTFPTEAEVQLFPGPVTAGSALSAFLQIDGTAIFSNATTDTTAVIGFRTRNPLTRQETPQPDIILGPNGEKLTQSARGQDLLYTLKAERPATEGEKAHQGTSGVVDPLAGWGWALALAAIVGIAVVGVLLLSRSKPAAGPTPPAAATPPAALPPPVNVPPATEVVT